LSEASGHSAGRHAPDALTILRDPATIRERCACITRAVDEGRSAYFALARARLDDVAARVERVTRTTYPQLRIPYHSRWRHFEAGGTDRKLRLDALLEGRSAAEQARARIDLTVVSVLLDAGAGARWKYADAESGQHYTRSEGLGVASFNAFVRGDFSTRPDDPLRVDAAALRRLDAAALKQVFQVSAANPMVGLEGRAALLQRLGNALPSDPQGGDARPGLLYDRLTQRGERTRIAAADVLRAVLEVFSPIWLTGSVLHGVPLGDVWPHPFAGGQSTTAGWVPFHKLSQWLVYSLLEPFEWAGVTVDALDALTALPEYRNGGLLLDAGVIVPRDARLVERIWKPADTLVVEWRALTVSLLDELAPRVRERLGFSAEQMPLARVLEGGTWQAGRQIAKELRDGNPPLLIDSDGTVF
jgi:Protein of unknown function (DUF1688)